VNALSRIAGRAGLLSNLSMNFYHNGALEDPYAIRRIDIYRGFIRHGNLCDQIIIPDPDDVSYPFPLVQNTGGPGSFELIYDVPLEFTPNQTYFDVWRFLPYDIGTADINDESLWLSQNGQFWVFDDVWLIDDFLQTKRIGFEPLDKKLRRGEIRTIEIALHPLPKYDFNYNKLAPVISQLAPSITICTINNELINGLVDAPCSIGIRQGHHLDSPYVIQCLIDTRLLLRGTYKYAIKIPLNDGSIIISDYFYFTVQ